MNGGPSPEPMPRLSPATLARLPAEVARPTYAFEHLSERIVHLGIGAFHRAHQADYFDRLMALEGPNWGIHGASLRSRAVTDQLQPQAGLYTLATIADDATRRRVIGAIAAVSAATDDPAALVQRMARPNIELITLTITEKGYCHRPADGSLDVDHPDVVHDLAEPARPRGALGLLTGALALRYARGMRAPTVLSSDNLPANGRVLRGLVLAFAAERDPALARWIEANVAFPSSMVDRIVPATTAADRAASSAVLGVRDDGQVKAEPFTQWVIENRFAGARPALDRVGVEFVDDVQPFEFAKLRLLNGAHSALAYLGQLAGHEFVADAIADPALEALVTRLMDVEVAPTLKRAAGLDPRAYAARLRQRFANRALAHRTAQIAIDGSQKLPQRLLGTAADRLAAGQPVDALALSVAAWMRYVGGDGERGVRFTVDDPLADELAERARSAADDAGKVDALLAVRKVFPEALAADPRWRSALTRAYRTLVERGARATAAEVGGLAAAA